MAGQLTTRNYAVIETEDVLIERVRHGDPAAFEALFLRHYAQVFRVAYNLVGSREEAEDLAQETFLALYRRPPAAGREGMLIAWLSRVVLNRGYNALRSWRRAQERIERMADVAPQIDPPEEALRSEQRACVRATIAELPERQGQLLLLRYAGLSYGEIAAALDVAPASVGTLLARAERAFIAAYERLNDSEFSRQ